MKCVSEEKVACVFPLLENYVVLSWVYDFLEGSQFSLVIKVSLFLCLIQGARRTGEMCVRGVCSLCVPSLKTTSYFLSHII